VLSTSGSSAVAAFLREAVFFGATTVAAFLTGFFFVSSSLLSGSLETVAAFRGMFLKIGNEWVGGRQCELPRWKVVWRLNPPVHRVIWVGQLWLNSWDVIIRRGAQGTLAGRGSLPSSSGDGTGLFNRQFN
jgi:hypothetical protein